MDKETLIKKLDELGVNPNGYSFTSDTNFDCVSVVKSGYQWPVVYTENNGVREVLATFNSQEEAYDYMYNTFVRWHKLEADFVAKYGPRKN